MRKQIFIFFIIFSIIVQAKLYGQSVPMYSQYMYNMTNINPAYSGNRGVPSLAFIWRNQWVGLPGAPSSKSITFDMPSENKKMGYGIQLFDDKYVSVIKRSGINLFYNIKVQVSEHGVLSLGLKGGFYNDSKLLTNVNLGPIVAYDYAFSSNVNKFVPLIGAGLYYNDDHFYAGFSAPDAVNFSTTKIILIGTSENKKSLLRKIVKEGKKKNIPVFAAVLNKEPLSLQQPLQEGILLIGNESKGLSPGIRAYATKAITIPRKGKAESLNAGVATAVILAAMTN